MLRVQNSNRVMSEATSAHTVLESTYPRCRHGTNANKRAFYWAYYNRFAPTPRAGAASVPAHPSAAVISVYTGLRLANRVKLPLRRNRWMGGMHGDGKCLASDAL